MTTPTIEFGLLEFLKQLFSTTAAPRPKVKKEKPAPGQRFLERYQERYSHVLTQYQTDKNLAAIQQRRRRELP